MKKRLTAALMCALMLLPATGISAATEEDGIIRIGMFSDSHILSNNAQGLTNVMNNFYSLTEDDVDGVVMAGDIINMNITVSGDTLPSGNEDYFENTEKAPKLYETLLENEYVSAHKEAGTLVFAMGNHEIPMQANTTDGEIITASRNLYKEKMGLDPENVTEIGGYTFITAGAQDYAPGTMTGREEFMKAELKKALEADSAKPVFLVVHHPIKDTFYDTADESYNSGVYSEDFINYLNTNPRIVVISGHIHIPSTDPRSIHQEQGGATYVQTSHVSGGNNVFDSHADERASAMASHAMIMEINTTTNVVTLKRFYVNASGGEFFDKEWTLDIPAMTSGDNGAYKYTADRENKGAAPVFASGSEVTVSEITDSSATITFPVPQQGNDNEESTVMYYNVNVYDADAATLQSSKTIISDHYKQTIPETFSYTLFDLNRETNYKVEVTAESVYFKESENSLSSTFKTIAPEFEEVTYTTTLTKNAADCGTQTNVPDVSTQRYGDNLWGFGPDNYATYTFDIAEAGVYRLETTGGSAGTTAKVTIDGTYTVERTVNTASFNNYVPMNWVDYGFTAGTHTITYTNTGSNNLSLRTLTLGKFAELGAADIGYTIEMKASEFSASTAQTKDTGYHGLNSGQYTEWSVTPEYSGIYDLNFKFGNKDGSASGYVDGKLIGTKAVTGDDWHTNTGPWSMGKVALVAGQIYTVRFLNETNATSTYLSRMYLTWESEIDPAEYEISAKGYDWVHSANYSYADLRNTSAGNFSLTYTFDLPVDAMYEVVVNAGVDVGVTAVVDIGGQTVSAYMDKTAENNVDNLAWNTKQDFVIGRVMLRAGQYKLVLSAEKADSGCALVGSVTLTTVGGYVLDADEYTTISSDYSSVSSSFQNNASIHTGTGWMLFADSGYWAEYAIEVGAGNYDVYISYGVYNTEANAVMSIDGTSYGSFALAGNGNYASPNSGEEKYLTTVRLNEGRHKFRFTRGTSGDYYTLFKIILRAIDKPDITIYSGEYADSNSIAANVTDGAMTVRTLLPKELSEKPVTMVFAIYEDNALYAAKASSITAGKNSAISATIEDIATDSTKHYETRVFFLDGFSSIRPLYPLQDDGIITN